MWSFNKPGLSLALLTCLIIVSATYLEDLKLIIGVSTSLLEKPTDPSWSNHNRTTADPLSNASSLLSEVTVEDDVSSTKLFSQSPSVQSILLKEGPDGCGLDDGVEPRWVPYTQEDLSFLHEIQACKSRLVQILNSGDDEDVGARDFMNLTKLDCHSMKVASLGILLKYQTIYMIGDSLLRQQFMVLQCMLNPNTTVLNLTITNTKEKVEYRTKVNSNTTIIYTPFGAVFPNPSQTQPLYKNEYPAATANGTANDLIVINAGHHYNSEMSESLESHVNYIVKLAYDKPIHVYFMETTDEQWPTSNGMYPAFGQECCCGQCACEILIGDKIRGNAALDEEAVNFTKAFGRLYPNHDMLDPMFDPDHRINHSYCVPDCYPANWKNELVRPLLVEDGNDQMNNVHVIPTWRQLVARKLLNNVGRNDCTHKSVDTTIEINRQFVRTVARRHKQP